MLVKIGDQKVVIGFEYVCTVVDKSWIGIYLSST